MPPDATGGPAGHGFRLSSPTTVRELLGREGLYPRHSMGQNFLVDANVLRIITDASGLSPFDSVVEVGAGLGALTQALVEKSGKVYAVESDPNLVRILTRELSYASNLTIFQGDAMSFDLSQLWEGKPPEVVKMVSNLPYQIAASLIVDWLREYEWLGLYIVMLQREVADRISAVPGGKDYSSATVKIQYRAAASRVARVSRNSFYPKPRVDSTIIKLERRRPADRGITEARDVQLFDRVVSAAFHQRRKKLVNAVTSAMPTADRDAMVEALKGFGRDETARAEQLSVDEFARLTNAITPVDVP